MDNVTNITSVSFFPTNNTTNETATGASEGRSQYTVWFVVVNLIALLGAAGNLALLAVLYRQRRSARRSGSHILIGNLAFSYMLMCCPIILLISLPMFKNALLGHAVSASFCRHQLSAGFLIHTVGVWTEVALAVNRIFAVFVPYKFTMCCGKRFNLTLVLAIWIMGLCMSLPVWQRVPSVWVLFRYAKPSNCASLTMTDTGQFILYYSTVIPFCMTCLASVAVMVKSIWLCRRRRASLTGVLPLTFNLRQYWVVRRRLNLAKTIFVSYFWCALCNLPTLVSSLGYRNAMFENELLDVWLKAAVVVGYAFSPIIFFGLNDDYRRGLRLLRDDIRHRVNSNS